MKNKIFEFGFAQIPLVLGLLLLAVVTPLSVKLVQQNQDKRSSAVNDGSCYAPKLNQNVTDGSFICSDNGYGDYNTVSKCNYGSIVKQYDCGLIGCIYVSKVDSGNGILKTDTACRNDDRCKNKNGTCTAPNSASNGNSCVTSDGKTGKVEGNLCFGTLNKKCCVPSETASSSCSINTYVDGSYYKYITDGSTFCANDGWAFNDLKKCTNGTITKVKSCASEAGMRTASCAYTSKTTVGDSVLSSSARCRTDSDCTDKGGTCSANNNLADGKVCATNNANPVYGTVKSGLCWKTLDKKCCVPNSNSSSKKTGDSCSNNSECPSQKCVGGRCIGWDSECNSYGGTTGCASGSSCIQVALIDGGRTKVFKCSNKSVGATCYYNKECASGNCNSSTHKCVSSTTSTRVNGSCGGTINKCNKGTFSDTTDSSTYYRWNCKGSNGGTTASCSIRKSSSSSGSDSACTSKGGACVASNSAATGSSCTVNGKRGKVQSGLCLRTINKKCCVPNN